MDETDYLISLPASLYVIQDPTSKMPIGVGERKDRVFVLSTVASISFFFFFLLGLPYLLI